VAQTSDWDNISGTKTYPAISLSSGNHALKLEYKTAVGATRAKLSWVAPPAAPTNLAATPSTSSPQITLSWNENDSNVSGYKIERSAAGGAYTQIGTSSITSYTDAAGLAYGATYTYRVTAYNSAGSNAATSNAATTIPAAPTNLAANCPNSTSQINLSWTNNSNADGIRIDRSTDNGNSYPWSVTVGGSVTSYTDSGLVAETTYTYRVTAYNSTGHSGSSNTNGAITGPDAPTNLVASPYPAAGGSMLTWTSNGQNISSYIIYRDGMQIGTAYNSSFVDQGPLIDGYTYCYQVVAVDNYGRSSQYSNASCMTYP